MWTNVEKVRVQTHSGPLLITPRADVFTIAGSELGAQVVLWGELGLLLGKEGPGASRKAADKQTTKSIQSASCCRVSNTHPPERLRILNQDPAG